MSEMRTIRFFPDWGRKEPLWDSDAYDIAVRADDLPIDPNLRESLYSYMRFWEQHFDPFENWDSEPSRIFHEKEGSRLVHELNKQLEGFAEVVDKSGD